MSSQSPDPRREKMAGILYTVLAFLFWGLYPPYWKLLAHVPPFQVVGHRVVWACAFTALLITLQRRWPAVGAALASPRARRVLLASGLCVTANWAIYIYGVLAGRLVAVSMGYFINPLVSVLLGVLFLKERLRFWQVAAVLFALAGVSFLSWRSRGLPWISLSLAFSFGIYGLLRKTVAVEALPGTFTETLLVTPLAVAYLGAQAWLGQGVFGRADLGTHLGLAGAGMVTALPIIWFAHGARRIPLSLVGFFQYLSPTAQLLLGIFLYGEEFTANHLIGFGLIWLGIVVFTAASLLRPKAASR